MIPDLVITDLMMPYMDGFELVAKLRDNEYTSHIPIIMLTAKADMRSKIEGLQQGVEVYLEKPFDKEELVIRIAKLLALRKILQQYYLRTAGIITEVSLAVETAEIKEDAFLIKVREIVEEHLSDVDFTVEKLCRYIFMSHSQLHRKIEAVTGCSPNKFIRMLRLKKARQLLAEASNSIAAVALDCGYSDPGYFARVFKREYNMTPQEWRSTNS